MRSRSLVGLVAGLALVSGCKPKAGPSSQGGAKMVASTPLPPIDLKPLPDAPAFEVSQVDLPGGNGELAVVAARPQGKSYGNFRPTITFSKPVVAISTAEEGKGLPAPARIDPPLPGEWRWLGSASVEFVPKGLVPYATTFTVTVPAGLKAVDGVALKADYSYSFSTPSPVLQTVEPSVASAPYYRAKEEKEPRYFRWLSPQPTLTLVFDQPVADLVSHCTFTVNGANWPLTLAKEVDVAAELRASEKHRRNARESFEETGFKNEQTRYELTPGKPLPLDAAISLDIAADLHGKEGPLTLSEARHLQFRTYGPAKFGDFTMCAGPLKEYEGGPVRTCAYGPLVVFTSNKMDVASMKSLVSVEPKVELDWDHAESSLPETWTDRTEPYVAIPGKFRPGTNYTVTIAAGAKDEFGQAAPAARGSARTSDLTPYFSAGSNEALLEAAGDGSLPVESANVTSLDAAVWTLTPAQMAELVGSEGGGRKKHRSGSSDQTPAGAPKLHSVPINAKRNVVSTRPLPIRDLMGTRTGLFFASITAKEVEGGARNAQRVVGQITDLAVHAKLGATSGLIWVTRLSDGSSVEAADLVLYDKEGDKKWEGKTDGQGLAKVPGLSKLVDPDENSASYQTPFALVAASKGGDTGVTISQWTGGFAPWSWQISQDWDGKKAKSLGFVVADRGIYRPGDTVYLKGLARYRQMGEIKTPGHESQITVEVTGSRGKELLKITMPLTDFGTFASQVVIPADAPLGEYEVHATGTIDFAPVTYYGSFRVEEYRAPQFKVDVTASTTDFIAGDPLDATVLARYLFGGAMSDAEVKWSVNRHSTDFNPPGNEGFSFGANTWEWDDSSPEESSDVASSGTGRTDVMGALQLALGKAEAPGNRAWSYTIEGEVADVSRQRMAARVSVMVHPAAVYAGVRQRSSGFAEAGKTVPYEIIAVDPKGKRADAVGVEVAFSRREWKFIRKKGVGDRWFTETQTSDTAAGSCSVKTAATPVECSFTPKDPGFYIVAATATDSAGRKSTTKMSTYVTGPGWVSWQRNDTDRIDLVADKTTYDVGETARILVKSPYPNAEAVLTVEREGVLTSRRVKLAGSAVSLEVPIDESLIPNAFVGVVLVRGRVEAKDGVETGDDPGRPAVRVGYTQIKVEKKSKRLNVAVTPDSKEKRPRDKVKVDLAVTDWKGKGVPTEVAVWAVDEGVLRLTGYEVPDPIAAIHPDRGLSVRIGEPLLHLVMRKKYGEKGENTGGSGGKDASGSDVRREFKTTVIFAPTVMTDATGHAKVEFDLPDNLTTFRIMALAITKEDRFGTGQSEVVVSKPLLAMPSLPRLARVGDRFEAGVVIHSPGAKVKEVKVTAEVTGLTLEGPSTDTVSMADAAPKEVRFKFKAEVPGTAVLRFRIEGGGEIDAVEQKIPVQLPVGMEAVAVYGDTKDDRTEGLVPPGGVRTDMGGMDVTLASTIMGGFDENMRQLVDYPWGCLEQLTSRLIPFVELRKIHSKFNIAYTGPSDATLQSTREEDDWIHSWIGGDTLDIYGTRDPDVVIKKTLSAIQGLANHDGGFKYWDNSDCSDDWSSSYAVLVLKRAADVGYPVDRTVLAKGQDFLADTVAAGKPIRCGWGEIKPDDTTRINALYALARTGKPKASYYGELFKRRDKLPLFALAMLADAMYVGGGDRAEAKQLFTELLNHAKESPREVHFEETDPLTYATRFSSDTRTTAIILGTLTDIAPDHPYVSKIGNYLTKVRQGNGRFRNTQEAGFALMALSEVVATKEKDTPDFTASVTLGKDSLASVPFKGRDVSMKTVHVGIDKLAGLGGKEALPFDFKKTGAGVLYYGALLRYAPMVMPMTALDKGMVVQRWFEPYQGGGQVSTVRAGELVRIRVRLATHTERHFVAVDVPLPAGLEAVNTALASSAQNKQANGDEGNNTYEDESAEQTYADGRGGDSEGESFERYAGWFWSPFNHTEQRDDRVVLFADELPPGVHTASFVARATTPGEFVLKPAHAEEMYTPEVFGRSDGGTFKVVDEKQVAGR